MLIQTALARSIHCVSSILYQRLVSRGIEPIYTGAQSSPSRTECSIGRSASQFLSQLSVSSFSVYAKSSYLFQPAVGILLSSSLEALLSLHSACHPLLYYIHNSLYVRIRKFLVSG